MGLNLRQQHAYCDICDIYEPENFIVDEHQFVQKRKFSETPKYSAIACRFSPNLQLENITSFGHVSHMTSTWRFEILQEVCEGWIIQLKTQGHPQSESYWKVTSVPKMTLGTRASRVNQKMVLAHLMGQEVFDVG